MLRESFPAQALIAATDSQGVVVDYKIKDRSFKTEDLKDFLISLRAKVKKKKFYIFWDNCSTHRTKVIQDFCK